MKWSFVFAMLFMASIVNAQRAVTVFKPLSYNASTFASTRNVIDTLVPLGFIPANEGGLGCFTGYYNSPDSGYVSGNNQYGDLEKAQFFSLTQMGYGKDGTVDGVLIHFAYKTVSQAENIVVKVYDNVDSLGFHPQNLLGTSNAVDISSIATDGASTYFSFPNPIAVHDSFFVSVQLPTLTGDTVVILSTVDDCVTTSGWSWELWSNGLWHQMLYSWVLNVDLAIFPIAEVNTEVGINDPHVGDNNLSASVFPNPANDLLNLQISNPSGQKISMQIINQLGRTLWKNDEMPVSGKQSLQVSTTEFESGIYTLMIRSNTGNKAYQLTIQH
jgi:hypothetical protein